MALAAAVIGLAATPTGTLAQAEPAVNSVLKVPTQQGPPQTEHLAAARYLKEHPDAAPQGANDFGCKPSAEHPRPVIFAHGTDSSAYSDWSGLAPLVAQRGICVFALDYGGNPAKDTFGTEDVWVSSAQIGVFVDQVLAATGATQVDLVGFSQGASVTRYWINKLGGAPKVGQWIGLASPSYGGVMYGLVPIADAVPGIYQVVELGSSLAAVQQAAGAPFIVDLNAGGDTVPGVTYTTIGSRVDEMIQPNTNIALHGAGATNIVLQNLCADDLTGHFHMVYDPYVQQLVANLLDPAHAVTPACVPVALGTGISDVVLAAHS
ncbi:alpha/beta fold hydrolase [Nocardia yunnanensis]|uniref:Alpha/beta fold hydrolase n=2 Tax=Nocardia yunnanensis TaxID=2382165 RepID=A0A386Z9W5_9NOCA|nr:alpha/beta fold hydrolase [Nocardia yunnanensis]